MAFNPSVAVGRVHRRVRRVGLEHDGRGVPGGDRGIVVEPEGLPVIDLPIAVGPYLKQRSPDAAVIARARSAEPRDLRVQVIKVQAFAAADVVGARSPARQWDPNGISGVHSVACRQRPGVGVLRSFGSEATRRRVGEHERRRRPRRGCLEEQHGLLAVPRRRSSVRVGAHRKRAGPRTLEVFDGPEGQEAGRRGLEVRPDDDVREPDALLDRGRCRPYMVTVHSRCARLRRERREGHVLGRAGSERQEDGGEQDGSGDACVHRSHPSAYGTHRRHGTQPCLPHRRWSVVVGGVGVSGVALGLPGGHRTITMGVLLPRPSRYLC